MSLRYQTLLFIFSVIVFAVPMMAMAESLQKDRDNLPIQGVVVDKATNEPIAFANVVIKGTSNGVTTDFDGNFEINLGDSNLPDEAVIIVSFIGYKPTEVKVKDIRNKGTILLEPESFSLEEVELTAKADRTSVTVLNLQRKEATKVVEKVGRLELSRKGASDVATGLTKMTGIVMVGQKQLFVRGLGDRYNNVQLNGLPLPSTNPDKKMISLDLFPTHIVNNLEVSKSFSADLYGDFSGGTININTKDYTDNFTFSAWLGGGYNTLSTGSPFKFSSESSNRVFGLVGQRALPSQIQSVPSYESSTSSVFSKKFSPTVQTAMPNTNIGLSMGNYFEYENGMALGFVVNTAFKASTSYREGLYALYNAQGNPNFVFDTDRYTYSTNFSNLANVYFKINSSHNINYSAVFINDTSDEVSEFTGSDNDLGDIFSTRNTFRQNALWVHQLRTNHDFASYSKLTTTFGYSQNNGQEPDRTQNSFLVRQGAGGENLYTFSSTSTGGSAGDNHRFFSELEESDISGKVEYTHRLLKENEAYGLSLTGGWQFRKKNREFRVRQIDILVNNIRDISLSDVDNALSDNNLGESAGQFSYRETYYPSNDYDADLLIHAGYAAGQWDVIPSTLQLTAGLRAEVSDQNTFYKLQGDRFKAPFRTSQIEDLFFLPSASLKYIINDKHQSLLSYSRTISRPSFVEATPFRYQETFAGFEVQGNPFLVNGINHNFDLKYEFFPTANQLTSVNLFGKLLQNPIEKIIIASSSSTYSYINTKDAVVAGVEVEFNRNIGNLIGSESEALTNMSIGLNATYMYTQISIDDSQEVPGLGTIVVTNSSRPLTGASPYILNLDWNYRHQWTENIQSTFTLTYNTFGRRLFTAGTQGAGDIYELSVNTLDMIVQARFFEKWNAKFSAKNILDPAVKRVQESDGGDFDINEYRRGSIFSLSLNYSL